MGSGSQIQARTIRFQIFFYRNSKFEESRLKNGEKVGDSRTDAWTNKVNEFNRANFSEM
jgi:hypothetical protein